MQKSLFTRAGFSILCLCLVVVGTAFSQNISPYLVGNNAWIPAELTDEIWRISSECPLQSIRIGGEGYDNSQFNPAQLDGFVDKIQNICKAQPIIQVPSGSTAEYAASLVQKYSKDRTANKVQLYNIGNEPGLGGWNAGQIASMIRRVAPAMKAVDPTIRIFAFDECDLAYNNLAAEVFDTPNGANDVTGKDANGNWYVDGIAWHRYPMGKQNNLAYDGYTDLVQRVVDCKAMVDRVNKRQNRSGAAALSWGIGEFNSPNGPQVHTFACGQMVGGVFGQCMKYEATYACLWDMFERGGDRQNSTDFSWIDGVGGKRPRAMYWHMAFISREFSGVYADGTCNVADVLTYGCKDTNKLCAILINRAAKSQTYTLRFDKTAIAAGDCRINIDAGVANQYQGAITGPATQCLVFNLNGDLLRRYNYASSDFDKMAEPTITQYPSNRIDQKKTLTTAYPANCKLLSTSAGLTVTFPTQQHYELDLISCNGRVVVQQSGAGVQAIIDTRGVAAGMYLVRLTSAADVFQRQHFVGDRP
jgi:hypothetical protein